MIPRQTLSGTRFIAGTYTNGVYIEGTTSPLSISASVQPIKGRELESLPEGRRDKQALRLYTNFELRTAEEDDGPNADQITIDGKLFEVIAVENWANHIINHFKVIVSYIGDAE